MRWAVSRPSRLQKFWIYLFLHITIVRVANAFPKEGSQAWCGPGGKPTDWLIIVDHDETPYRMWWMSSWDNSRSPEFLCLTPQGPDEPSTLGCYCEDFGADLICPDRPGWFDWNKAIQDYCQGHCRCPGNKKPLDDPRPPVRVPALDNIEWVITQREPIQNKEKIKGRGKKKNRPGRKPNHPPNAKSKPMQLSACPDVRCKGFYDCALAGALPGCVGLSCVVEEVSRRVYQPWGTCSSITASRSLGLNSWVGRRDVREMTCACNSTYLSHGCCGAHEGFVWEEPEAKLGEIGEFEYSGAA
ncbi:MAG: hypothetical protein M1824_000819 [Vezdaea acicularis]|nr:MAG: hypothetical protein M1824_000819 [Vezdaea acicularis]